jgi:hypothetical protein
VDRAVSCGRRTATGRTSWYLIVDRGLRRG